MPLQQTYEMSHTLPTKPHNDELDSSLIVRGQQLPSKVIADLRTDHAGEVGAVCIYKGILLFSRDPALRSFAKRHLETEQSHLLRIKAWLSPANYSRLLPIWHFAGFLTGALPALFGARAVYATIEAVETFVDLHYEEQIQALASQPELLNLRETLQECQADEIHHRVEAASARGSLQLGFFLRLWCATVAWGSRNAVLVCRYI
jgi:ubiquinone biosynthesis monooxygenase Coq7